MADELRNAYQLAVVGGGPGGYAAAFLAADLGMDVALITAEARPGGECLHRGCIPSKALLHLAKLIHETREAAHWGLSFSPPRVDLESIRTWKSGIIDRLSGGILELCRRRNVALIRARAMFLESRRLALHPVEGSPPNLPKSLAFDTCILASGSRPAMPQAFANGDPRIMDSSGALALPEVPPRLLVIGGGYIGLEMGTVYSALGSRVTLVELADGLLPGCDRDLVQPLQSRLEHLMDAIHLQTRVEALHPGPDGVVVSLRGSGAPETVVVDRVLVAVGRAPNSSDLGLENTRVELDDRRFVRVNERQQTHDPYIYAIGDVAGEPMLAHKAAREGKVAVEAIAGRPAAFDNIAIPAVVFTDPEVAWCGLTENQARIEGREIAVARFPWAASGRAATMGRSDGLTKLIFDPQTDRLLGVGIVGPNAGDLIAEGVLAIEMAAVVGDVAESIHAHPTLSETVAEAADVYFGHATHIFRPRT